VTTSGSGASVEADAPVVLVTGASSGIGRATAIRFGRAGYRVAVNYARDTSAADEVAALVEGRAYRADVADRYAVATMVSAVEAELGPIAVAVCNAGFYEERRLEDVDDSLWDRSLRVMLGGCFHVSRTVVPRMRSRGGGSIVTIASELALIGGVEIAHYVAAKAAILGLTRSLARELAPTIRVNAVAPGAVDTPLLPDRDRGPGYTDTLPLRRIGRADEVADVVFDLAHSAWTTGAVWQIDGGAAIQ